MEKEKQLVTTTSQEIIQQNFQNEINKANWEKLSRQVAELQFTEDNLDVLRETKIKLDGIVKLIDKTHSDFKRPYLDVCQRADSARRDLIKTVELVLNPFKTRFNNLCKEIEEANKKAIKECERKRVIQEGIEKNLVFFSTEISKAETIEELEEIKSKIRLDSINDKKYQEFLEVAAEKYSRLTVSADAQIEYLKKLAVVQKKSSGKAKDKHTELKNEAKVIDLKERLDENRTLVQEQAVTDAIDLNIVPIQELRPVVKPKRTNWGWELVDLQAAKEAGLTFVSVDSQKVNMRKDQIKEEAKEDFEELIEDGIRYFKIKTY